MQQLGGRLVVLQSLRFMLGYHCGFVNRGSFQCGEHLRLGVLRVVVNLAVGLGRAGRLAHFVARAGRLGFLSGTGTVADQLARLGSGSRSRW